MTPVPERWFTDGHGDRELSRDPYIQRRARGGESEGAPKSRPHRVSWLPCGQEIRAPAISGAPGVGRWARLEVMAPVPRRREGVRLDVQNRSSPCHGIFPFRQGITVYSQRLRLAPANQPSKSAIAGVNLAKWRPAWEHSGEGGHVLPPDTSLQPMGYVFCSAW